MNKKHINYLTIIIPLLILNVISLFNMYNSKYINNMYNNALIKQLIWFIIGYLIIFIVKKFKFKKILYYSKYLYIFSCILLLLVLFIGNNINGAKCWFNIFGFSFQPSELTKFSLSLYLSYIIVNNKCKNIKDEIKVVIKLFILFLIPSVLVFLEPDTGAIISFFIIFLVILFNSKLNKWWYIIISIIIVIIISLLFILYFYKQDILINIIGTSLFYRMDRIINFTQGNSYQLENSLTTIGYSSFLGVGFKNILLYIPEAPTDFIFAFSIGNFGILSAIIILLNYFIIDIYLIIKSYKITNTYYKIITKTYTSIFIFSQIYNIMMNIGLLPIMGIPLTFLSYGGTNILINYLYLAFIINEK